MKKAIITLFILLFSTMAWGAKYEVDFVTATGAGVIDHTFTAVYPIQVVEIKMHLSAAATQDTVQVNVVSANGADLVRCAAIAMAGSTEYLCDESKNPFYLNTGDTIHITFANNDLRTVTTEMVYEN